ncbi:malignant fibrous histiocytoma-amplified sequence 1 homolog [Lingula anatina]|uniref:Malignant fibrous histiocytoma-amplified sequence 1 homolog n=1 Tax=Lingula anatina TaxID=7574 RepID=A0A1S3JTW2_LINAN|nr:malignant fibrous histiocytoma-amplified sequence 1 homolog [Lingula anatina]XP_013413809.1 malignant fibrous histiocytoma-amplified sequence 1 homolog [Lingula anatina]XP_013413810.1 malignant fibrous histiocytoma-amplified sequence 1 homolog [Lingula anatina]|eukprot:XP_013413808.1 malignant fibrous histiocytoma-amplified sequence 1 homolog [Lingula anatina]
MAYRQVAAGKECLDLFHRPQLSPKPPNLPETVLQWIKLDISHADIDRLPESIARCKNAKHILAGGNRLSSLPQSISNLPYLTVLDLYRNAFTTFPIALCRLTNLEELYLNNNKLSDIPKKIAKMKRLRKFMLDHNALTTFPIALCGLTNLEELYLGDNQLSDIPEKITRLVRLKKFWLYKNKYTKFPIALCGMTNLEDLYLDKNQLSDIPTEITGMKGLKIFWLSHNEFKTFPTALCDLTNLEELDLGDNQLSDIPLKATTMEKLQSFGISFNNITHLLPQMKKMISLRQLYVVGNRLLQPPMHTAKQGLDAIKRYFEALTDTKAIQSSRIQVNFLGETESGKTSISHSLQLGQPASTESADRTRVVEQETWVYDQDIAFNINDFGGHEVYKIGHPIFMSKHTSSLVFITFDLSKYDPEDKAHYQLYIGDWIDKVQAQMPGIQIALIGTHLDEAEALSVETKCSAIKKQLEDHKNKNKKWYDIQKETVENKIQKTSDFSPALRQAYQEKVDKMQSLSHQVQPIYEHIFRVSSENMTGVEKLKKYLIDFARERAEVLPELWVNAAKNICTKKQEGSENTLDWEMLQELIMQSAPHAWRERNSHEETKKIMCDILSFLAHRGDIIWFDKSPSLTKVVFHKQEVLENVLKAVLSHDPEAVLQKLQVSMRFTRKKARTLHADIFTRGIISRQAMSCLCEPFKLSTTEVDAMIDLLLKLELCFQVQEHESNLSFHFPCLLQEKRQPELETKWPSKVPPDINQLTLQVIFPYRCPDGLYEKFSVRQHKHLGLLKTKRMDWRNGMYAELERCKMLLTQERDQQNLSPGQDPDLIISIAVRGQHLSDQWQVLKRAHGDLMNIIHEDWPGLPYDKYLVCPHCMSEDNKDSEHQTLLLEETPNVPLTTTQDPEEVHVPTKRKRYTQKAPTLFPGEILDQTNVPGSGPKEKWVPCVNTGVYSYIPVNLVYPPSWQDAIRKHKTELCENITEPCLLDMLDKFLQEGIITDREAQTVRAQPSTDRVKWPEKVAVFLDILMRKPSKAHVTLCQCLLEQERTDLLELIM